MDPHERAFHMREQLKQIYRARLPDMGWCDDISQRKQQVCSNHPGLLDQGRVAGPVCMGRCCVVQCGVVWQGCDVVHSQRLCYGELFKGCGSSGIRCVEAAYRPPPCQHCRRWRRHSVKCAVTGKQRPTSTSLSLLLLWKPPALTTNTRPSVSMTCSAAGSTGLCFFSKS